MALNRVRLEEDLSYDRLSALCGVNSRTLYRILTTPNAKIHDRTLFKIQKFLAGRKAPRRTGAAA